ncbi:AAA family ATPase [Parapedobacter sp. 2B3]|uniref:AAA family ATPase n=1 Tax=Parapedobacter sp. 2B3 TaxID=3342381 RepID=UPI0035B690BE
MRIRKLQLKNGYKRFHDLTIDLGDSPKRIIALVGPNGCGKSSVLDSMLKLNTMFVGRIGVGSKKGEEYHSNKNGKHITPEDIKIEFVDGEFNSLLQEREKAGSLTTIFSFRSPYRYNSDLKIAESKSLKDLKLNQIGASTTADLDDRMVENYRRLYVAFNTYLEDNPNTATYNSTKEKIIGDLNSSLTNCLNLEISSIGKIEADKGTLFFRKPDHSDEFEYNVLSAGEKEVVDIILDLYLRRDDYTDTIFLIDEPELHLNTAVQRRLLIEINRLIGPTCQVWIATHSIGFLRSLQEDYGDQSQIIHFKSDIKWASESITLKPMEMTRANWQAIFSTALDDLTELVAPKRIVYCEGIGQPGKGGTEKGFDANVLNNIFSEKYPDTLFISSGGNTELDQRSDIGIAILSKVFKDVEILVLKDRDTGSGKYIDDSGRAAYLQENPDFYRMLKRWELENYLFDKEVLQKYCKVNSALGYTFDETAFDNFVKSIIDQNVKDSISHFRNFCRIKTSIGNEKFKLNLSKVITPDMVIYKELESVIF